MRTKRSTSSGRSRSKRASAVRSSRSVARRNTERRSFNTHFHRATASVIAVVAVLLGFGVLILQSEQGNQVTGAVVGYSCDEYNPWQCTGWSTCVNNEMQRVCSPPSSCASPRPITKLPC